MIRKLFRERIRRAVDETRETLLKDHLRFLNVHHIKDRHPEDVYIVGYPKSGTTLMQHLVAHHYFGLSEHCEKVLINTVTVDLHNQPYYARLSPVCFFKSHALPDPAYRKVIYMVRDGRDANLSLWYMQRDIIGEACSLEDTFLKPTPFGSWGEHVLKWTENPHGAEILFVRYEDLLADKKAVIRTVSDFLAAGASDADVERTAQAISLDHMRKLEDTELGRYYKSCMRWEAGQKFSRKGESGSHEAEVPSPIIDEFNEKFGDALKRYRYL